MKKPSTDSRFPSIVAVSIVAVLAILSSSIAIEGAPAQSITSSPITSSPVTASSPSASEHPARVLARDKVLPLEKIPDQSITIDGSLAEWEPLSQHSGIIQQNLDHLAGPLAVDGKDAAAIKLRKDGDALYVAVRVVDGSVINPFGPELYHMGDCLELFLDVRPLISSRGHRLGDTIYSDGVYQMMVAPPTPDGKPLRWTQANQREKPIGPIDIAGRLLTDGYAVELKIPFTSLPHGSAARFQQPVGIELMVDDRDADQKEDVLQQRTYSWGGLGNAFRDPSAFAGAWSGYQPATTLPVVRTAPARLKRMDGKYWIRVALVAKSNALLAEVPINLTYRFDRSEFDRVVPPIEQTSAGIANANTAKATTPDQEIEHDAVKPEIAPPGPVGSILYPQLGVIVHQRAMELKKLPPGRYSFDVSFPDFPAGNRTTRYYGLPSGEQAYMMELHPQRKPQGLPEAIASSNVYIVLENHYPSVGQPIRGEVGFMPPAWVLWELSEQAERSDDVQRPYFWRLDVIAANGTKSLHRIDLPIRTVSGNGFVIPANKLRPASYQITMSLVTPAGKSTVPRVLPAASREDIQGRTMVEEPTVPLVVMEKRQTLLPTTLRDAPELLTQAVEIGSPNRERFPQDSAADARARSVWDLHVYRGRLYVGCGEWTDNRGPIDIWSYAPVGQRVKPAWIKEFTVDDESVDRFRDYDGKLYVPGIDAREDWGLGNLYIKSDRGWQKKRTVVNGIHVFDAAEFQGKLYVTTGTEDGAVLFESSDGGDSWVRRGTSWREGRFYEMIPLRDSLLLMPQRAQEGAYRYQNGKLTRLLVPLFPGMEPYAYPRATRLQPFGAGAVYTIHANPRGQQAKAPLFFLSDLKRGAVTVQQFRSDHVTDVVVRDGKCYVLTAKTAGDSFEGTIYSSSDLKAWTRLAAFKVPALPKSIELMDHTFYVGLANRHAAATDAASGSIWMISQ